MIYEIFGRNVRIDFDVDKYPQLLNMLSLYPTLQEDKIDIEIRISELPDMSKEYMLNPKDHYSFKSGFIIFDKTKIMYVFEKDILKVFVEHPMKRNLVRKASDMGFETVDEKLAQILHELVLVPINYFFDHKALIHASAFISSKNVTYLIGGTSGAGKTSLELHLCREKGCTFLADDMCVVDDRGYVYPNLAFPKIYACNVVEKKDLLKELIRGRGFLDRLHWHLRMKLRGDDKVIRKKSPVDLYGKYSKNKAKIGKYFILAKDSTTKRLEEQEIPSQQAIELTTFIIQTEYYYFFNHVMWHEYNCSIKGISPIITYREILSKQKCVLSSIFERVNTYLIKIPVKYDHKQFLEEFHEKILE